MASPPPAAPKNQSHPRKTSSLLHEHKNFVRYGRTPNSADRPEPVEFMMVLEEKFGVSVGEGGAEDIATVQDAADLIEKVRVR
ncbi:Acyl carrier protein 1, chloroplastic [Sesamum angolense]|uniref:Acyl carrier protein 1, chloroplastic n=1 Tax=Sesamum angolense TaxID=2727404 RepID=A0AAE2BUV1_9LAMI|nr:Acyl carrier protein 1, chloroplastic [Sesamum angolense]